MVLGALMYYPSKLATSVSEHASSTVNSITKVTGDLVSSVFQLYQNQVQSHKQSQARILYALIPKYIKAIIVDIKRTDLNGLQSKVGLYQIAQRINSYLSQYHDFSNEQLGLETTEALRRSFYDLATEVKKADYYELWSNLNEKSQAVLNAATAFFAPPQKILPYPLQYASDRFEEPRYVSFNDHMVFLLSGGENLVERFKFDLPGHKGYSLYKTQGITTGDEAKPLEEISDSQIELMSQNYDYKSLAERLNRLREENGSRYEMKQILHQMVLIVDEYRKELIGQLGVPLDKPVEMSKSGEWEIFDDVLRVPLKDIDFAKLSPFNLDQIASDVAKNFILEKRYNIDLLGPVADVDKLFMICNNRAVVKPKIGMPSFLKEAVEKRHEDFLKAMSQRVPVDFMKLVKEKIRAQAPADEKRIRQKMDFLKLMLEKNIITESDLLKPSGVVSRILAFIHDGLDLQKMGNVNPEYLGIWLWLQRHKETNTIEDMKKLASELLNKSVDTNHVNKFELFFDKVMKLKAKLSQSIYAHLAESHPISAIDQMENIHVKALALLEEISRDLRDVQMVGADHKAWKNASDHFWKLFAEEFLEDFESKLMNFYDSPVYIENALVMLRLAAQNSPDKTAANDGLVAALHK